MSKITDLFKNKWMALKEIHLDNGTSYTYASDIWCDSEGVAIMPFKLEHSYLDVKVPKILGRYEICPSHSLEFELYSITGGMDKEGESPAFTAKRELLEETGYDVPVEKLVYLGEVKPSKSSDKTMHLFAVNVEGYQQGEILGDNTKGEEGAYVEFITTEQLSGAKDPLLHVMFIRAIEKGLF